MAEYNFKVLSIFKCQCMLVIPLGKSVILLTKDRKEDAVSFSLQSAKAPPRAYNVSEHGGQVEN